MKQKRAILCLVCVVLLIAVWNISITQAAQTPSSPVWIGEATAEGIHFYISNDGGGLDLKGTLADFGIEPSIGAKWLVPSIQSFILSPDKEQIAFSAKHEDEFGFFIFTPKTDVLQQKAVSSFFTITWSPDGQALVLSPRFGISDVMPSEVPPLLVYDVATEQFTEFAVTGGRLEWLPNSDGFVFLGHPVNCKGNCPGSDLYVMNRVGQDVRALTDVYTDAAAIYPPNSCLQKWSPTNRRYYYVVGCGGTNGSIYSTDLNGNNRLELALPSLFSEDTFANTVLSLDVVATKVLISYQVDILSHPPHWRVLSLSTSGDVRTVFDYPFTNDAELYAAAISPTGETVAFNGIVIDTSPPLNTVIAGNLISGEIVSIVKLEKDSICNMQWRDSQYLLFEVHNLDCNVDQSIPKAIFQLNIADDSEMNLTQGLDHSAWLLPVSGS